MRPSHRQTKIYLAPIFVLVGVVFVLTLVALFLFDEGVVTRQKLYVPEVVIDHDEDGDGILDLADIVLGARGDVENKSQYKDAYYRGGYPPEDEGVCADVIWRAFKNAGYNLKDLVDRDIKNNKSVYPRIRDGKPDPNIDFRRVDNLIVFFRRHATELTTKIEPGNVENLMEWQGGDIVVFDRPHLHIAIVSPVRDEFGVPFMIHNSSPTPREEPALLYWHEHVSPIIYHFRWPNNR